MPRLLSSMAERLEANSIPEPNTGCWLWTKATCSSGYGTIHDNYRTLVAHRVSFAIHRGPIPEGMHLDHLCRTRACINPWHLEPVTNRENVLRGQSVMSSRAAQMFCKRGHFLSGENVYRIGKNRNGRACVRCARDAASARYRRLRAKP